MGILATGMITIIVFLVFLIIYILFLVSQQNILKAIKLENRTMSPGMVWLQLIPVFNLVWQFMVVIKISESIRNEMTTRTFSFESPDKEVYIEEAKPTFGIGIACCILLCLSFLPMLGIIMFLAYLVCWIIYWLKIVEYKNRIIAKNYSAT